MTDGLLLRIHSGPGCVSLFAKSLSFEQIACFHYSFLSRFVACYSFRDISARQEFSSRVVDSFGEAVSRDRPRELLLLLGKLAMGPREGKAIKG
jgi:hypothetical protein